MSLVGHNKSSPGQQIEMTSEEKSTIGTRLHGKTQDARTNPLCLLWIAGRVAPQTRGSKQNRHSRTQDVFFMIISFRRGIISALFGETTATL